MCLWGYIYMLPKISHLVTQPQCTSRRRSKCALSFSFRYISQFTMVYSRS